MQDDYVEMFPSTDTFGILHAILPMHHPSKLSVALQILTGAQAVGLTLLANQSTPHALPTALNAATTALLRAATGDGSAGIKIANHPMPTLVHEASVQLSRATGNTS